MGKVRKWKDPAPKRASTVTRTTGSVHKMPWAQKEEDRARRRQVLQKQRILNDEIAAEKRAERERIEEKRRRKEENRAKTGSKLQLIKDPKKIKKLSKKQLRAITTADTTGVAPLDKGPGTEVVATAKKRRKA